MGRRYIGDLVPQPERGSGVHLARCNNCDWRLRRSSVDEAREHLISHNALSHPETIKVYVEGHDD